MKQSVRDETNRIIDRYFHNAELNGLMKSFIAVRAQEESRWGKIVEYSHRMLGGNSPDLDHAAALAELLMTAIDIIDDLQDRDKPDRAWMTCPEPFTLNAMLGFLAACMGEFALLQERQGPGSRLRVSEVGSLIAAAVNGQQCDVNSSVHIAEEADYFSMVQHKSGSFIRLACYLGYALAEGVSDETVERMNDLAYCYGVVAQMENDVNDLIRFDKGNDLLQKKRTLPILHLLTYSEQEFPPLARFYAGELSEEQFLQHKNDCMQYIADSGCIEYAKVIQALYFDKLTELYEAIPALSPWKERFKETTFARYDIGEPV